MKLSKLVLICSLACVCFSQVPRAFGQGNCGCSGGISDGAGEIQYSMSGMQGASVDAEALLEEVDNPGEVVYLTVIVPEKAIVSINDEETYTTGTTRTYVAKGLKAGKEYTFRVKGLYKNESGAEYSKEEKVTVKAGESSQVVLHLRRTKRTPPAPLAPAVPPAAPAPAKSA
jgi:uncharacterized protein (TIGR03000 family)